MSYYVVGRGSEHVIRPTCMWESGESDLSESEPSKVVGHRERGGEDTRRTPSH